MHRQLNKKFIVILLLSVCVIFGNFSMGQRKKDRFDKKDETAPPFHYSIISSPIQSRDSVQITITIKTPFDAVQFIKQKSIFKARYEASVLLLDEEKNITISKIWTQTLITQSYAETNSSQKKCDIISAKYKILPGKYHLKIGIRDLDTQKNNYNEKTIDFTDYYKNPITISELDIVEYDKNDSTGQEVKQQSVENVISDNTRQFQVNFNVLSEGGAGTLGYKIINLDQVVILENHSKHAFYNGITPVNLTIQKEDLKFDKYILKVIVNINEHKSERIKTFQLRWFGMSSNISNLDEAVDQMQYIATYKELKKIKQGTKEEIKKKFQEFWRKRDTSPQTPENELMNEYYMRVNYSNKNFHEYKPGWRTDRGMIFILFGPPNDIERHPFDINSKPYQIWYYHTINRTFYFIDENGFGEYRLMTNMNNYYGRY